MKFLSIGAGAVSTYIAGSLEEAGHEIVLLLRPAAAARVREHGLHLTLSDVRETILSPGITESAEEAFERGPFDAVIFAVKAYQVRGALLPFAPLKEQLPPILCLQNGIGSEDQAASLVGAERVVPATLTSAVSRGEQGSIILERKRGLGVADTHSLAPELVDVFNAAGLNAHLFTDAAGMKWSKLLTNLLANASSAILDMTPDEVFADPGLFRMEMLQLREAMAVMASLEVQVINLPGTPVRALAWASQNMPLWASRPLFRRGVGRGRGDKMPSFHIDLYSGRQVSEIQYLNGAVSAYGGRLGIPTPVNTALTETLLGLINEEEPKANFAKKPERLLARLRLPA